MKKALDIFSKQARSYKKYRPIYPQELYDEIMKYVPNRNLCWDCGTGNGQVALALSEHFSKIYATDLSHKQLAQAHKRDNIIYKAGRAESTEFEDNMFDLITVAQAIHWFDIEAFNKEALRVSKNGAIVAIWGYGLVRINERVDAMVDQFYQSTVGPYWNEERKHIDNAYTTVKLDFEEIEQDLDVKILVNWNIRQFEGYLNSWSGVQNYKDHQDHNPVTPFIKKVRHLWDSSKTMPLRFPIYLKVGRVVK